MKNFYGIFVLILLLLIGAYSVLKVLDLRDISRVNIDFELPLPDDVSKIYGIDPYPRVTKVILTGFFSDWDPGNENYILTPDDENPQNHRWSIDTVLSPGEHQYKFAVYIEGRDTPIWSQDKDSYRQVYNGMESFNSLIMVKSYENITTIILNIIYILLIIIAPYLFYLFVFKGGLKQFIFLLSILLFISNILFSLFTLYYNNINYTFTSKSIITILQNDIISNKDIYRSFNYFLWYKLDKLGIRNISKRFRYISLYYFDLERNLLVTDYKKIGEESTLSPIDGDLFEKQLMGLDSINVLNYKLSKYENIYNSYHLNGKNSFIYPVIITDEISGFIGICYAENLSNRLNFYMKFNIITLLVFLTIIFLFALLKSDSSTDNTLNLTLFEQKFSITAREMDIILKIIDGLSNKEIADNLNISKRTVDNHVYNVLHKSNARNRIELINIIKKLG